MHLGAVPGFDPTLPGWAPTVFVLLWLVLFPLTVYGAVRLFKRKGRRKTPPS